MISTFTIVACVITLLVSLVLPIAFIIFYGSRHKGEGVVSAWLLGALGFVVPQIVIRVPLLQLLSGLSGFMEFAITHYVICALALGFTAGLFEFAGRYTVARDIRKKGRLNYRTSLAAGLGHGGIEAILIVGISYINNLIYIAMIQNGSFDARLAQTAATGVDVSQLYAIRDQLVGGYGGIFLLGGFERLLAMTAHVGMSMVVCYTVYRGKTRLGAAICIGYHTFIDTVCGLIGMLASPQLGSRISQAASYWIIYSILLAMVLLALYVVRNIRQRWNPEQEVNPQ